MSYVFNKRKTEALAKFEYKETLSFQDYTVMMEGFKGILGLEEAQIESLWGIINPDIVSLATCGKEQVLTSRRKEKLRRVRSLTCLT